MTDQLRSNEASHPSSRRPRLLMFAYSCHPETSMESRVGWNRAILASQRFDTWVLVGDRHEVSTLNNLAREAGLGDRLHFMKVSHGYLSSAFRGLDILFYQTYALWQRRALKVARQLHAEHSFDLVHQVNFCGYREPGFGWELDIPFLWGPVGGTQNFPWKFLRTVDLLGGVREAVRNCINRWQLGHSPRVSKACRKAAHILTASTTAQRDLQQFQNARSTRQLEIGLDYIPAATKPARSADEPLHILWAGRLRTWKGFPLLAHALAQLPKHVEFKLRVMGEGCCQKAWINLVEKLEIADRIEWIGWPSYRESLKYHEWADVFAFTSLRDTSGTGLLEALAAGTPIVGLNHQGAADIMTRSCAIPIEVTTPAEVISQFCAAIERLATDRRKLAELSQGAIARAKDFHWNRLGSEMDAIYTQVLAGTYPLSGLAHAMENREVGAVPAIPLTIRPEVAAASSTTWAMKSATS